MKNFSKNGAKFAAAIAMSVMALGYTTSVWAEMTNKETVFKNIKGTQTEILNEISYRSNKADEVKAAALGIYNVEKLNINSEKGLIIGCQAIATKNAEGIGIHVKDAQADFKINGNFVVQASGVIRGTEENVSMKAVGFYGENGSSQIVADSVSYTVQNEDQRRPPTGTLDEESLGMALNKYAMNIFAKENKENKGNIEISSLISTENMLAGEKTAQGMVLNSSKASLHADENISISAAVGHDVRLTRVMPAISVGHVNGIHADLSELDMQAGGTIIIGAGIYGFTSNNNLAAINASNSKINIKAEQGIEIKADNGDAIVADKSEIALDGGSSVIAIRGNVNVLNNSTLKLSGVTSIGGRLMRIGMPGSDLNVENSTLVVDGLVTTSGKTKLNNAKIYMYDANNAKDDFHYLAIRDLEIIGSNELFLRADSSTPAGGSVGFGLNSDLISIGENITGDGKFNVNVFDKGMKNGYGMSTDGTKALANSITVLYNRNILFADASLINSVKDVHYDNGIWSYAYKMAAELDDSDNRKIVIKEVGVTAAPSASGSQRSLHSANKAAGALAIGVLGNDNALHAHLREAQGAGEREEVWAQYLGGKLKSDGMQLKHNGVELGYDAYVGNNWTFGVSGMQTRGNTQLDSGSGKAKTNVGTVYGAWHGDGGAYVNLEAKAGRVSSESKTFGGTVMQKISGEFSAPAYSVSAEYGSTHELPAAWYLEPAVRLSYVHMGAADYSVRTQETLARVANDSFDSIILRGGAKLGRRLGDKGSFYVKAAAVYDFGGDLATTVSADGRTAPPYEDSLGGWGVEYGAGVDYRLSKATNVSFDVERRSGGDLRRDWGVNVGVNYSF